MEARDELREQGRGMVGSLLVLGVTFSYTMETWWLSMEAAPIHLIALFVGGLAVVVPVAWSVGFHTGSKDDKPRSDGTPLWIVLAELVFQSAFIAIVGQFLFGILTLDSPFGVVVRAVTVQVVPLAFGAALANELLSGEQNEMPEAVFPQNLGVFALGAVFVAATIAPTEEVALIAQQNGWLRHVLIVVASLLITFLALYVLDFRGQSKRIENRERKDQAAQAVMIYVVSLIVSFALLVAFGTLSSAPASSWVRRTVVLGFPSTVGASAARVVLS